MSSRYQYTTMDRVFAKVDSDITSEFEEDLVVEWTGEALAAIESVKSYEEEVIFLEVRNHQVSIPKYCHAIIQIARDNQACNNGPKLVIATKEVKEITTEVLPDALCCIDDSLDYNLIDECISVAQTSIKVNYKGWVEGNFYRSRFTPVRLKDHTLFNTLVCSEPIVCSCVDEYTIIMGDTIRFSFQSGRVAVAFLKQALDEKGWPLIPDTYSHLSAIECYIRKKLLGKKEYGSPQWRQADNDWQWYCKQASNIDMMPHGIDEHQNLLDQRSYLLPRQNSYFGFFGNLSRPEDRRRFNPNTRRY